MNKTIFFTILLFATLHSAVINIGYIPLSANKTDPGLSMAKQEINTVFLQHCGIQAKQIISANYKITGGINYKLEFSTLYGKLSSIAFVQPWDESVQILQMNLQAYQNLTAGLPKTPVQANAKKSNNINITNNTLVFLFPELKDKCEKLKLVYQKLKLQTNTTSKNLLIAVKQPILTNKTMSIGLPAPVTSNSAQSGLSNTLTATTSHNGIPLTASPFSSQTAASPVSSQSAVSPASITVLSSVLPVASVNQIGQNSSYSLNDGNNNKINNTNNNINSNFLSSTSLNIISTNPSPNVIPVATTITNIANPVSNTNTLNIVNISTNTSIVSSNTTNPAGSTGISSTPPVNSNNTLK